jgi:hypothetical protein
MEAALLITKEPVMTADTNPSERPDNLKSLQRLYHITTPEILNRVAKGSEYTTHEDSGNDSAPLHSFFAPNRFLTQTRTSVRNVHNRYS